MRAVARPPAALARPLAAHASRPLAALARPLAALASLALAALAGLALAAAPADGASGLVVRGAGFGHGIGMSQYGAVGFARAGADHPAILGHYYAGTRIERLEGAREVRILLKTAGRIVFTHATGIAGGRPLDPARRYVATRGLSGAVQLRGASGRALGSFASPLRIVGADGGFQISGRSAHAAVDGRFRGALELRATALGGVSAINALDLDEYLRGVVAGEMPASWPQEALRAQAVAARTYALATTKGGDGFDHYADTRSQVYDGIDGETKATDEAVAATRGEIVTFDGKAIETLFFSASGGRTENVENVFLGAEPVPYLTSVEDPYDHVSPRHRWTRTMSLRAAQRRLGELVEGRLVRIRVLRRGRSPRVVRAQIVGTRGRATVSGPTLRARLGLYDTWARFTVVTAHARRGDGNRPSRDGGGATPSGGATARAAASGASPWALTGRVDPAPATGRVTIQRRVGDGWRSLLPAPVGAGGRYRASLGLPGTYRVLVDGAPGPSVRVGTPAGDG